MAPNAQLNRRFTAHATAEGKVCAAVVLDPFSRRVFGLSFGSADQVLRQQTAPCPDAGGPPSTVRWLVRQLRSPFCSLGAGAFIRLLPWLPGAAGNDVRSDTGRRVEEFAMTDMPDFPGRTDDKTTEDAGQDLTGPRETSHPTPGMTRRSRTSKTSRPAGLADPCQQLDLFQPYCPRTMLVPGRDPTPCRPRLERCTAASQDGRYGVNRAYSAYIETVPRAGAVKFGWVSSARLKRGAGASDPCVRQGALRHHVRGQPGCGQGNTR